MRLVKLSFGGAWLNAAQTPVSQMVPMNESNLELIGGGF
jgi:hypothetical protein